MFAVRSQQHDLQPDHESSGSAVTHGMSLCLFANLLSLQNGYARCYYTDSEFTTPIDATNYTVGPFYCDFDADGYRLPTEGEWEYFTRAGTTTAFSCDETNYTSGNCSSCTAGEHSTLEQYCVYCANDPGTTAPVGSKLSNPWNLKDVHGNVWEWCWDWYEDLSFRIRDGLHGTESGSNRVNRGGGWTNVPERCRSARRVGTAPWGNSANLGLRLLRTTY